MWLVCRQGAAIPLCRPTSPCDINIHVHSSTVFLSLLMFSCPQFNPVAGLNDECLSERCGSNSQPTGDIFLHTTIGERAVGWIYNSPSLSPFLNMLNGDDKAIWDFATGSSFPSYQSHPGCFNRRTESSLMSPRSQTPLTPTSLTCAGGLLPTEESDLDSRLFLTIL